MNSQKRTLGIGSGKLSKKKPVLEGARFALRPTRGKKRRRGIFYVVFKDQDGARKVKSTRQRLPAQAADAARIIISGPPAKEAQNSNHEQITFDILNTGNKDLHNGATPPKQGE